MLVPQRKCLIDVKFISLVSGALAHIYNPLFPAFFPLSLSLSVNPSAVHGFTRHRISSVRLRAYHLTR